MEDFYFLHNQNLISVEKSINSIKKQLKNAIRQNFDVVVEKKNKQNGQIETKTHKNRHNEVIALTRLLSFLTTCWAEVRILKVIFEHNSFRKHNRELSKEQKKHLGKQFIPVFSETEKKFLLNTKTAKDKWIKTFSFSIAKAFSIPINIENNKIEPDNFYNSLPTKELQRYKDVIYLINNELFPSQQLRNRIAHGQWITAFSGKLINKSADLTASLDFTPSWVLTSDIINSKIKKEDFPENYCQKIEALKDEIYKDKMSFLHDIEKEIGSSISSTHKDIILKFAEKRGENIETLQLKLKIFKDLSQLIHDITVSVSTFKGGIYKLTNQSLKNLKKSMRQDFADSLQELKDIVFSTKPEFLEKIKNCINDEKFNQYIEVIIAEAYVENFNIIQSVNNPLIKLFSCLTPKFYPSHYLEVLLSK